MGAERCRYAPSTTGHAHPGTLLAALLAWLDARSRGAPIVLRLEDLDPERCRPEYQQGLVLELAWLGLDFDQVRIQHHNHAAHVAALDLLAAAGRLYPCRCTRAQLRAHGRRAADGGFAYPNTCRDRPLPPGGWRAIDEPLRFRLPDGVVEVVDEGGEPLTQAPAEVQGDPVLRRRDGAIAYQLAVVVDDAHEGITRVVRGRDIAPSTATQVALQHALGLPTPAYRHHLLLLEPRGAKLAKLHGSVGAPELRAVYSPRELVGWLAHAAGLLDAPTACSPEELVAGFAWSRVRREDRVVTWDGARLALP
jgi:glutamyl-Q tRNA(Asp) synthetase